MSSFIDISVSTLCVLSMLMLSACGQSENPRKTPPSADKTVAGTWFEGEWSNKRLESAYLSSFQVSADTLILDGCALPIQRLVSKNELKDYLVIKERRECVGNNQRALTDIALERKGTCEISAEFFASADDVKQGSAEVSATYTKSNCTQSVVK